MRYLESFVLPQDGLRNTNIYPYNVFARKYGEFLVFDRITVLYGDNGSGKSTLLRLLAHRLGVRGGSLPDSPSGHGYFARFAAACALEQSASIPPESRFIKSEDILYEIKKIDQEEVLHEGYRYHRACMGQTKAQWEREKEEDSYRKRMQIMRFAQERYSNGQTALQVFDEFLQPHALYLIDEPEVSLSPENQLVLARRMLDLARLEGCQFIIATHSPFFLGTLDARVYDLGREVWEPCAWSQLASMRLYARFFRDRAHAFSENP